MIRASIGTIWIAITRIISEVRPEKFILASATAARKPMASAISAVAVTTIRLLPRLVRNRGWSSARL